VDGVIVRRATVADVPTLAALRRAWTLEDERPGELRDDFEDAFTTLVADGIAAGRWVVWVGEVDGEIASHAFVAVVEKIPRPVAGFATLGYLTNVYTRPEHRGHGLGGRVLGAVIDWARDAGLELLVVWPSEASIPVYERHGFADRGEPLVWRHPQAGD
jgi:GNAT superfamily N-acetyltransferase